MYGHTKSLVYDGSFGLLSHSSLSTSSSQSQSLFGEFNSTSHESAAKLFYAHESSSTGSRPSSYTYVRSPASPPRSCTSSHNKVSTPVLQRSLGIHPVQSKLHPPTYLPDTDVHPVRQDFNCGDLDQGDNGLHYRHQQHRGGSPLDGESVSVILQRMTKACRYSSEEKRERIERYRTKRSRRNFHKKIQYECRKTLADSRPRIRGRFARNDETEKTNSSADLQWSPMVTEEADDEDYEHWIYLLHSVSSHGVP
ncbi:hypothetical protein Cgig2_003995 [Carnegiea gigantea]|uniref:CCT domain-containing protein n=1 Tax=Carnegiea gigantea TaxID=171969 RepID=A0A9Q1KBK4_9CARY|nr:hypothetical protein Cgig2_003995 [Carnegiea gigantea]